MITHAETIGAKSVGQHHSASGIDVGLRHFTDSARITQVPEVGEIAEPESAGLHFGSPRTVRHYRSTGNQFFNEGVQEDG